MRLECVHPKDLGPAEAAAWRRLRDTHETLASPYFSLRFAQAVGAARDDARVVVVEDGGAVQGFFPAQRPSSFAAMAMGMPISDYQGLIAPPTLEVTASQLCRALRVGRIDFSNMAVDSQGWASGSVRNTASAYSAVLGPGGAKAYVDGLRVERADTVKKMNRKRRAMDVAHGGIVFTADDRNLDHRDQLLRWCREKCRESHFPRVWERGWVVNILEQAWASQDPDFRVILFTDKVGDRLAAAQLLLQSGPVLHTWLIGHDSAFDAYSPGTALTRRVIEWAADNGFREVDLGMGDYRFKRQLTNRVRNIGSGYLGCASWATMVRTGEFAVCEMFKKAVPINRLRTLPAKAMQRLDAYRALGLNFPRTHP
jgi:CelD/BcsL family acetyltransferase involved in cellulose biosynthesis